MIQDNSNNSNTIVASSNVVNLASLTGKRWLFFFFLASFVILALGLSVVFLIKPYKVLGSFKEGSSYEGIWGPNDTISSRLTIVSINDGGQAKVCYEWWNADSYGQFLVYAQISKEALSWGNKNANNAFFFSFIPDSLGNLNGMMIYNDAISTISMNEKKTLLPVNYYKCIIKQ